MASATFKCPSCHEAVVLYWPTGQTPPATEACEFCDAIEPLRREWSPIALGAVPGGASPSRVSRPSRV